MSLRVSIQTLGCRLNQADSALLAADFTAHGYAVVPWGEPVDVAVINSCAVTAVATQKSRHAVSQARRLNPQAFVVLCGCAASDRHALDSADHALPDLVVPNPKPPSLAALLPDPPVHCDAVCRRHESAAASEGFVIPLTGRYSVHTRAHLKIQEGCNFHCTYCIVPQTRGESHSRDKADVLREARELLACGHKELVITGVNIATYCNHGADLAGLLEELLSLPGDFRLRLGSVEPGPVLDRLISLMEREDRICRFLHLPVQYGHDAILRRMGRHYDCAQYAATVADAVSRLDGICIGTDLMVGFPGEDDAIFEQCRRFVEAMPYGLMHVFSYSPRQDTPAAGWPRPPSDAVASREKSMLALARRKAEAFARHQLGRTVRVLIEKDGSGWSENYLKVQLPPEDRLPPNSFCTCRICAVENAASRTVRGELSSNIKTNP